MKPQSKVIMLDESDFEVTNVSKTARLKEVAIKLSKELSKSGKAEEKVDAVIALHETEIKTYTTFREKEFLKNCLILLAAPKSLMLRVQDGSGKNAEVVLKKAAAFIGSSKDTIQRAAKEVRNIQGTARAEKKGLARKRDEFRKDFYKDLNKLLNNIQDQQKILTILRRKKLIS